MTEHDAGSFIKCPQCHRKTTAKLTLHPDGDVWLECTACEAYASVHKLHQHDKTVQ